MANVFDEQFKRRLAMHVMTCDPISADLIQELRIYAETFRAERDEARALLVEIRKVAAEIKVDFQNYVAITQQRNAAPTGRAKAGEEGR